MSDIRTVEVTTALVKSVRQILADYKITEDEFYPAVEFLADLAQKGELGLLTDALGLTRVIDDNTHQMEQRGGTASNVLGPYYRPGAPFIENGGSIAPDGEPGEPFLVSGVVTDCDGNPKAGALLDVWQANAQGEYEHQVTGKDDFYLRRKLLADDAGRYSFSTVRPVPYEIPKSGPVGSLLATLGWHAFRPAHIHFKVEADGCEPLTTQLYFEGDQYLDDDRVQAAKRELAMPIAADGDALRATFDIRLCPADPSGSTQLT